MYPAPIVRTYGSWQQYQQDAAIMAASGYQAVNMEQRQQTNAAMFAFILIIGLLLTPACIGIFILLLLPTATSKYFNVSYVYQPAMPHYSQPLLQQPYTLPPQLPYAAPPAAYPTLPPYAAPPSQPQPLQLPLSQPPQALQPPPPPPQFAGGQRSTGNVLSGWVSSVRAFWQELSDVKRVLVVVAAVVLMAVAVSGLYVLVTLPSFGAP